MHKHVADYLIHAKWIITCEDDNKIYEDYALVIKNKKIINLLPSRDADHLYRANTTVYYPTHAVMPGLINCHTHIPMTFFRGLADDLPLMEWLTQHIWPAEKKWLSYGFVYEASMVGICEMIRSGVTCFNDMYFFPDATAAVVEKLGIRAFIGMSFIDFPTPWAKTLQEYQQKSLEFYEEYKNVELITPTLAPHATYTLSDESLCLVRDLAEKYDLRINIHLHETAQEVQDALSKTEKRPLQRLHDLGMVHPKLMAVHMTALNEEDFRILEQQKPQIISCPESNMKLASGICPIERLMSLGLNVGLGTDGVASNNDTDMLGELRSLALLGKVIAKDPTVFNAETVLKLATLYAARVLGIDDQVGSLSIGKSADFIAIDLEQTSSLPVYHPMSQIVYAANRNQITDVWVNARQILRNRMLIDIDDAMLIEKAKWWGRKIAEETV